jgi:hypothetical protein
MWQLANVFFYLLAIAELEESVLIAFEAAALRRLACCRSGRWSIRLCVNNQDLIKIIKSG